MLNLNEGAVLLLKLCHKCGMLSQGSVDLVHQWKTPPPTPGPRMLQQQCGRFQSSRNVSTGRLFCILHPVIKSYINISNTVAPLMFSVTSFSQLVLDLSEHFLAFKTYLFLFRGFINCILILRIFFSSRQMIQAVREMIKKYPNSPTE